MTRLGLLLALFVLVLPGRVLADPIDDSVRRIGLQLQCPVCEGQNIADSPSGLAKDMRDVIRTRLTQGATDRQILDEFVASYGDSILTDPPKRGISLGVWLGPAIGLLLGAALLVGLLLSWRRAPRATATAPDAAVDPAVADEFRRFRNEFGR
jgi:cytochrome c-type biogenesis protein CcmH